FGRREPEYRAPAGRDHARGLPEHHAIVVERGDARRLADEPQDRNQPLPFDPDASVAGDTGIRSLDDTAIWRRVDLVDTVDEDEAWVADGPGGVGDRVEHAPGVEPARDLIGAWIDELVAGAGGYGAHERI